ncbi:MAG: helix-turn-helix domain-containing protein [Sutterella wadsworthensis]
MRPRKGRCRIEVMKANIAYKFELMPTREQKRIFAQAAGCRRFVWNKAIELQKRCLEQEVPFLKYTELAGRLVLWKKEDDMLWLQEAPSQALQQCRFPVTGRRLDADDKRNGGLPSGSPPLLLVGPASLREETGERGFRTCRGRSRCRCRRGGRRHSP